MCSRRAALHQQALPMRLHELRDGRSVAMTPLEAQELRALITDERAAIYSQAHVFLLAAPNGQRRRGLPAGDEFARRMLRNIHNTYAECRSRDDVMRVLGMEQTLAQILAVNHDAVVTPDVDEQELFVPILGQEGE